MSNFSFTTGDTKPKEENSTIPEGYYLAEVENCEGKISANNPKCKMYATVYKILDGEHVGKKVFDNHIFEHQKPGVKAGGRAEVAALIKAVGMPAGFEDPEDLTRIPLVIRVKISPPKNGYDASNQIRAWFSEQEFAEKDDEKHVFGEFENQPNHEGKSSGGGKNKKTTPVAKKETRADGDKKAGWKRKKKGEEEGTNDIAAEEEQASNEADNAEEAVTE